MTFLLPFFDHFVGVVLTSICDRFWSHLGLQNGAKIDPKSIQEPLNIHAKQHLIFDQLFD